VVATKRKHYRLVSGKTLSKSGVFKIVAGSNGKIVNVKKGAFERAIQRAAKSDVALKDLEPQGA
jgi:hypothetical protein